VPPAERPHADRPHTERPHTERSAERVLDAAIACCARFGVSKTTLDDVAREAGCARATVYRSFGGRDTLFHAAAVREWERVQTQVLMAAAGRPTLVDALTEAIVAMHDLVVAHRALQVVLANEPEVVLPYVSFDGARTVLGAGAALVADVAEPFLDPAHGERLGEWITRIVVSYLTAPSEELDLSDRAAVRRLLTDLVLPGFESEISSPKGAHAS
jgi:AcrR family transcriptional regulator